MSKQRHVVTVTTDASGNGVGYTPRCYGNVQAVQYLPDASSGYDAGATVTVTGEDTGETIWTETLSGAMVRRPRLDMHTDHGEAEITGETYVAVAERLRVTIASGGNAKTGTFVFTIS